MSREDEAYLLLLLEFRIGLMGIKERRIYQRLFSPIPWKIRLTKPAYALKLWRQRKREVAEIARLTNRELEDASLSDLKLPTADPNFAKFWTKRGYFE